MDDLALAGGGVMLRGNDVPRMMTRVQATLQRAERSHVAGEPSVYVVSPVGDSDLATARLRHLADIQIEFHSGSARPVIGPTVRLAKRAERTHRVWVADMIADMKWAQYSRNRDIANQLVEVTKDMRRVATQVGSIIVKES